MSRARKSTKHAGRKSAPKKGTAARKSVPKKAAQKAAGKSAGRGAAKKPARKAAKKSAPRKVAKKSAPRKVAKKSPAKQVPAKGKPAPRKASSKRAGGTPVRAVAKAARKSAPAQRSVVPPPAPKVERTPAPRLMREQSWKMPTAPVVLPRQPSPAAHAPVRKPPKPRAPKPKAISHEQAVANLQALLEAKKRREREGPSWPVQQAPGTPHRDEPTHAEKTSEPGPESTYAHDVPHDRGVTER
ncbi:MAG TPA: hypothetical protein VFK08_06340 [Rhodanobacteraceae bacterium]|nr:hypothetical protein [Rhodanobacteraceae bacterium]